MIKVTFNADYTISVTVMNILYILFLQLGGEDGCELKRVLALAVMEYKHISSYRAIVASTTAILNAEHHVHPAVTEGVDGSAYTGKVQIFEILFCMFE
jgi:hypothetical protein